MNISEAINIPFDDMDAGETTIKLYLQDLLETLLSEGESFSGKRPFGNSGWEHFAVEPLIKSGLLKGKLETYEEDDITYTDVVYDSFSEKEYNKLLQKAVEEIFK